MVATQTQLDSLAKARAARKAKKAEKIEAAVATEVAPAKQAYNDITYRPLHINDPTRTQVAGIWFAAGVAVRVLRSKTVEQLITETKEMPDGTVQTRGIHRKVPVAEMLRPNPAFSIDGADPADPKKPAVKQPTTAGEYRKHAMDWITAATDPEMMDARWSSEELLRTKCGVDETDEAALRPWLESKRDLMLGGKIKENASLRVA